MARVLTRPMFRKGGLSRETGIMSGLDSPRRSYAGGGNIGGGSISGNPMGSMAFLKSISEQLFPENNLSFKFDISNFELVDNYEKCFLIKKK